MPEHVRTSIAVGIVLCAFVLLVGCTSDSSQTPVDYDLTAVNSAKYQSYVDAIDALRVTADEVDSSRQNANEAFIDTVWSDSENATEDGHATIDMEKLPLDDFVVLDRDEYARLLSAVNDIPSNVEARGDGVIVP